ncbi:hypothetical protein [Burkholderia multivorans]|uniref:hypothetical protein n=1 Tax=Burkholderia multivorans TaxID=87883 RepID=UPI0007550657|nr:hypothetical protein [Burkholderia multivorans]KVR40731.1 hypothetical protein WK17_21215 [Burkholderia multivorans]
MEYLFRRAAVAAVLFDPIAAQELLKLPDAEVGRRFKICLARVTGMATVLDLDLRSVREQDEKQGNKRKRGAVSRTASRNALVSEGKLLRAGVFREALGITGEKLSKRIAKGSVFSVEVGGVQYYPAFFLAKGLNRSDLSKVTRRLDGARAWDKWAFFTESKELLGGLTPLQALFQGEVKQVLSTTKAVAKQSRKPEKGSAPDTRRS